MYIKCTQSLNCVIFPSSSAGTSPPPIHRHQGRDAIHHHPLPPMMWVVNLTRFHFGRHGLTDDFQTVLKVSHYTNPCVFVSGTSEGQLGYVSVIASRASSVPDCCTRNDSTKQCTLSFSGDKVLRVCCN